MPGQARRDARASNPPLCIRCGEALVLRSPIYCGACDLIAAYSGPDAQMLPHASEPRPRLVILESPYAGDVAANVAYARACLRDSLLRGEAPIASHLLYTQPGVLDDDKPDERALGIEAGLVWGVRADATVVYTDRGISPGMELGIARAHRHGRPVELRTIEGAAAAGIVEISHNQAASGVSGDRGRP